MDCGGQVRGDEGNCFQVVRCGGFRRRPPLERLWMLRVFRSLTCQCGFGRKELCPRGRHDNSTAAAPLLHRSSNQGLLSPSNIRMKCDAVRCCASFCMGTQMKDLYLNPLARMDKTMMEALHDQLEQMHADAASWSLSADGMSSEALSFSPGDLPCDRGEEDCASSSDGSSPLGWPLGRSQKSHSGTPSMDSKSTVSSGVAIWDEKREKRETQLSEVEFMKEKFAKLLLGEDMSGGGKGVCTALAISNAITNLSASVFGELWRLEPLSVERKTMWRREMEWLLSVADYVVELVPSWQSFLDGSGLEVMISRPRSDLHINLPALRKLDAMLLESLDSFSETEFWYVDQGIVVADEEQHSFQMLPVQRQQEKWWLPSPKVPPNGLSNETRKHLKHQRESTSQILKAAMAINSQILSEMEVPEVYWNALPKNGKASLGETIYRHIASQYFSPEALLCSLDLSSEHNALGVVNRIEAAIHVWRRKGQRKRATQNSQKHTKFDAKASWGIVRDFVLDMDRRELLAGRAESLLLCLKQRFPDLPQSLLDMTKIQYNRDVGQSILESYSRVLESLAFNIIARMDDVLYVDDMTKRAQPPHAGTPAVTSCMKTSTQRRLGFPLKMSVNTPYGTPLATPSLSPTPSPSHQRTPNSVMYGGHGVGKALSDFMGLEYNLEIKWKR